MTKNSYKTYYRKSFQCGCEHHIIEIDKFDFKDDTPMFGIAIYETRSGKTGRLYKKPKLLGDVVLHPDEAKKFEDLIKRAK